MYSAALLKILPRPGLKKAKLNSLIYSTSVAAIASRNYVRAVVRFTALTDRRNVIGDKALTGYTAPMTTTYLDDLDP